MRRPGLAVGSPAWFARLADDATRSFSFRSPAWSTTGLPCPPLAPVPLHCRGCARRQLVEMLAADLGFSVEEAIALLGADLELRLNREQVTALVESLTERELEVLWLLG